MVRLIDFHEEGLGFDPIYSTRTYGFWAIYVPSHHISSHQPFDIQLLDMVLSHVSLILYHILLCVYSIINYNLKWL